VNRAIFRYGIEQEECSPRHQSRCGKLSRAVVSRYSTGAGSIDASRRHRRCSATHGRASCGTVAACRPRFRGQQYEGGIKYQPDAKSLYTFAYFDLTQQNVLTADPDPTHVGKSVQTGEIRSRGVELEAKTEVTRDLTLLASYTYLDQTVTKSNNPLQLGKRPVGMPTHSASAWADYTFHGGPLDGFGLAGGIRYIGESAGTTSNDYPNSTTPFNVPSVTLFDAALHYDLRALGRRFEGFKASINATNLFDKTYVGMCQDFGCYYGLRRQVVATLRYTW